MAFSSYFHGYPDSDRSQLRSYNKSLNSCNRRPFQPYLANVDYVRNRNPLPYSADREALIKMQNEEHAKKIDFFNNLPDDLLLKINGFIQGSVLNNKKFAEIEEILKGEKPDTNLSERAQTARETTHSMQHRYMESEDNPGVTRHKHKTHWMYSDEDLERMEFKEADKAEEFLLKLNDPDTYVNQMKRKELRVLEGRRPLTYDEVELQHKLEEDGIPLLPFINRKAVIDYHFLPFLNDREE